MLLAHNTTTDVPHMDAANASPLTDQRDQRRHDCTRFSSRQNRK